jgi:hypothetical protein
VSGDGCGNHGVELVEVDGSNTSSNARQRRKGVMKKVVITER